MGKARIKVHVDTGRYPRFILSLYDEGLSELELGIVYGAIWGPFWVTSNWGGFTDVPRELSTNTALLREHEEPNAKIWEKHADGGAKLAKAINDMSSQLKRIDYGGPEPITLTWEFTDGSHGRTLKRAHESL